MFGIDDALLVGGLAAAGSVGGSLISANSQKKVNSKQVSMSYDLANTAHQREVRDLRQAGLNPILSAGGSGAGGEVPDLGNPYEQFGRSVSRAGTALAQSRWNLETEQAETNIKTAKLDSLSNFINAIAGREKATQEAELAQANTQNVVAENSLRNEFFDNLNSANSRMIALAWKAGLRPSSAFGDYSVDKMLHSVLKEAVRRRQETWAEKHGVDYAVPDPDNLARKLGDTSKWYSPVPSNTATQIRKVRSRTDREINSFGKWLFAEEREKSKKR